MDPKVAMMLETETNKKPFWWGLGVALVVHGLVLFFPMARTQAAPVEKDKPEEIILVNIPIKPLPIVEPQPVPPQPTPPDPVPMPAPDPDTPDPVVEPMEEPPLELDLTDLLPSYHDPVEGPVIPSAQGLPTDNISGNEGPPLVDSFNPGIESLQLIHKVDPQLRSVFPRAKVVVSVIIDMEGRVTEARVLSATTPDHGQAVLDVLPEWRYKAPKMNGKAVSVKHRITVRFQERS